MYESVLAEFPRQPRIWMSYGHALKTGRPASGQHCGLSPGHLRSSPRWGRPIGASPTSKPLPFRMADVAAMRAALARGDLRDEDKLHFEFSLGKALEDEQAYAQSFAHYVAGNALRHGLHPYSADDNAAFVQRSKAVFTAGVLRRRARAAVRRRAIRFFIVGMPRAGSTLLEQILASHSQVEGTMELPNIPQIARELAGEGSRFLEAVASLSADDRRGLGERYLAETRIQRKTDAPFFIDKMPNNCLYVGLIHLILPNAVIIDARRHPLGCCFSGFKQHFARGQNFSYGLEDIGRYYRDYVELMAQFDAALPGRVHRAFYETLIEDTEAQVRRLLDHCGLPFEDACLRFYENERAVRTASSEQVRRPIFREGMDHWRHYEPWLEPLKAALGPVLDLYPEVPDTH